MKVFNKLAIAALLASAAAFGTTAPAAADHVSIGVGGGGVSVGVGIGGGPVFEGDYDYYRPCGWYRYWNIPAPARCYREFWGFYGPNVVVVDGFVFRNRDDWGRWHDRDEWRHWRSHEFRRADWHDNGWHRGWDKHDDWHDQGRHADWQDNGHGDRDWHDNGDHGHDHGDHWHDHGGDEGH